MNNQTSEDVLNTLIVQNRILQHGLQLIADTIMARDSNTSNPFPKTEGKQESTMDDFAKAEEHWNSGQEDLRDSEMESEEEMVEEFEEEYLDYELLKVVIQVCIAFLIIKLLSILILF